MCVINSGFLTSFEAILKYVVPKEGLSLAYIFANIQQAKEELAISEYSVSQPTLEQIFVAIARKQEEADAEEESVHTGPRAYSSSENDRLE